MIMREGQVVDVRGLVADRGELVFQGRMNRRAGFDSAFLNAELKRTAKLPIGTERVIDTLVLGRRKHSGGPPRVSTCQVVRRAAGMHPVHHLVA